MSYNLMKVEKFKSVLNCKYCSKTLNSPITLPCGETICEIHATEAIENECHFCNEKHAIPEDGFKVNKVVKEMLDIKVDSIKLSPEFESCKKSIEEVKSAICKIDLFEKDPENFIYEYFEQIKQKVDLRRERLKLNIDEYSEKIIQDVESTREKCPKISKKDVSIDVKDLKEESDKLNEDFDTSDIDDEKFKNISIKANVLICKFEKTLDECINTLLKDECYIFNYRHIPIDNVFGRFFNNEQFSGSHILTNQNRNDLMNLCEFSQDQEWNLVYRASDDGFSADAFHSKCDHADNVIILTLTIIKTTNGHIFGGFIDEYLDHTRHHTRLKMKSYKAKNAFLFSLRNNDDFPFKTECINSDKAISNMGSYGPTFGSGPDFQISSDSNLNLDSCSLFGKSFKNKKYPYPSYILAGSKNFQTTEIEVYQQK